MVSALGDPYTEFMDPEESREFNEDMAGSFEGVGMEVGIRDDVLTVISPLEGTPAFRAGIMAGDKILEINKEITKGMNINEAVSKIRGPKGTEVVLSVFREEVEDVLEFKITRDTIVVKSVSYKLLENNLFLIKINSFNSDTRGLFSEAVKDISTKNPKGIIIDLRNNPGGYLETPVSLLGEWINGEIAVIEKFGDGNSLDYIAKGLNRLETFPTIVLINGGSASASEIMTGALQYYKKATVVGEKSYGKGSVQMIKPLRDGSALKITMAEWLTPAGKNINEEGIIPDIEILLTYDDYKDNKDPQLDKAIELLK
jgi:carboxyl-terminal processing protease